LHRNPQKRRNTMRDNFDRMRRRRYLGMAVALHALLLGACGGGVEGEYFMGEGEEGITLELRGDDVAVISIGGVSSTQGTYSVDGDTVTVTMPGGEIDIFTIVDGNLTTHAFGEDMVFEKQ
jgi:hypothetical protein